MTNFEIDSATNPTSIKRASATRYCVDCKWHQAGTESKEEPGEFDKCLRENRARNQVSGKLARLYCSMDRAISGTDKCGPEGQFYEAKEEV